MQVKPNTIKQTGLLVGKKYAAHLKPDSCASVSARPVLRPEHTFLLAFDLQMQLTQAAT